METFESQNLSLPCLFFNIFFFPRLSDWWNLNYLKLKARQTETAVWGHDCSCPFRSDTFSLIFSNFSNKQALYFLMSDSSFFPPGAAIFYTTDNKNPFTISGPCCFPSPGTSAKISSPTEDWSLHKYSGYGKVFILFSTTCHVDFIMNRLLSSGKQMETSSDSPCQRNRQEEGEKNCWIWTPSTYMDSGRNWGKMQVLNRI